MFWFCEQSDASYLWSFTKVSLFFSFFFFFSANSLKTKLVSKIRSVLLMIQKKQYSIMLYLSICMYYNATVSLTVVSAGNKVPVEGLYQCGFQKLHTRMLRSISISLLLPICWRRCVVTGVSFCPWKVCSTSVSSNTSGSSQRLRCLLVAHSSFPLTTGYDCFGEGEQQAREMHVRVSWKNREDMIIDVEGANMVEKVLRKSDCSFSWVLMGEYLCACDYNLHVYVHIQNDIAAEKKSNYLFRIFKISNISFS